MEENETETQEKHSTRQTDKRLEKEQESREDIKAQVEKNGRKKTNGELGLRCIISSQQGQ